MTRRYVIGTLLYTVTFGLSFVSVTLALALIVALALVFVFPEPTKQPTGKEQNPEERQTG